MREEEPHICELVCSNNFQYVVFLLLLVLDVKYYRNGDNYYNMHVIVSDGVHTTRVPVHVTTLPVNVDTPFWTLDVVEYDVTVDEDVALGTVLTVLYAADGDDLEYGDVRYDVVGMSLLL